MIETSVRRVYIADTASHITTVNQGATATGNSKSLFKFLVSTLRDKHLRRQDGE